MAEQKTIPVSADWVAAFERLAAAHGLKPDEFLALAELTRPGPVDFVCGSCERPLQAVGRFPRVSLRQPGDPFALRYSLRLFDSGVLEVHGLEGDETGYFCEGCAKTWMEPMGRIFRLLAPRELAAMGAASGAVGRAIEFIGGLFGSNKSKKVLPVADTKQEG